MSLINDALKKAQRQRSDPPFVPPPMPGGGGRITKRGVPMGAQKVALIVAGCIVLIVLSAVGTALLVREKSPDEKPVANRESASNKTESTPEIAVTPIVLPLSVNVEKKTGGTLVEPPPSAPAEQKAELRPAAITPVVATVPPVEAPVTPPPAPPAQKLPPGQQDERVHAFLDTLRVNGILPSGTGSRVLMNQRVYRVNDIVDRPLGLKLIEVQADSIKFTDANGTVYTKKF